ncbi:MAG: hypothetical protein Q7R90_04180 [bacterium]|nr:hypothetical protein [bacterium]
MRTATKPRKPVRICDYVSELRGWGVAQPVTDIDKLQNVLEDVNDPTWLDTAARQVEGFRFKMKLAGNIRTLDDRNQAHHWETGYVFELLPDGGEAAVLIPPKGSNIMCAVFARHVGEYEVDELEDLLAKLAKNFAISIED